MAPRKSPKTSSKRKSRGKVSPEPKGRQTRSLAAAGKRNGAGEADAMSPASKRRKANNDGRSDRVSLPNGEEASENSTVYAPLGNTTAMSAVVGSTGQGPETTDEVGHMGKNQNQTEEGGAEIPFKNTVELDDQGNKIVSNPAGEVLPTQARDVNQLTVSEPEKDLNTNKHDDEGTFGSKLNGRKYPNGRDLTVHGSNSNPGVEEGTNESGQGERVGNRIAGVTGNHADGNQPGVGRENDSIGARSVENPSRGSAPPTPMASSSQPSVGSANMPLSNTTNDGCSKNNGQSGKKWKWSPSAVEARYKSVMAKVCSGIDTVFVRKSVSTAIASSIIDTIYYEIVKRKEITSADLNLVTNLLLFGKQHNSNKAECFNSPAGILASSFRKKCIKNVVLHITRGVVPDSNLNVKLEDMKNRPEYTWLFKVIPSPDMCNLVSDLKEKRGRVSTRRKAHDAIGRGSRSPGQADISEYVLIHAYSAIVAALHNNRKAAKKMFFGKIGYLLTDWKSVKFLDVDQDVAAMWVKPLEKDEYLWPSEVPEMKIVKGCEDNKVIDEQNMKIFDEFVESRQELMVIVQHNVSVKLAKSKRESMSTTAFVGSAKPEYETRPFRRSFSLIGVALSVLSELCSISIEAEKIQLLKFHRKSLALCYFMAICFKETIRSCEDNVSFGVPISENAGLETDMGRGKEDGNEESSSSEEEDQNSKYVFDGKSASVIRDMLAIGETEARRLLERHVGNVLEKYWRHHHIEDGENEEHQPSADATPEEEELDQGVIEMDM